MRAAPSTLKRRSTALTSPLCDRKPRLWAISTLVATAACGGVRRNKSWATPSRNMSCTIAARGANGMLRQSAINASIWPRRRNTVATSKRANARSRPASSCIAGLSSIASSSGRLRRSTAPIRSSATLLAVDAWGIKVLVSNVAAPQADEPNCPVQRSAASFVPDFIQRFATISPSPVEMVERKGVARPYFRHGQPRSRHRRTAGSCAGLQETGARCAAA